jgi:shikimate kinase
MSTIVFIGFRGSGKTTLGRWLAGELGMEFIDTDALVLDRLGYDSVELAWDAIGEDGWREAESKVIPPLLRKDAVISFGGGAPTIPLIKKALSSVPIVFNLITDAEETARRITSGVDRPVLSKSNDEVRSDRLPLYSMLGTCAINTSGPIEESQLQILDFLQN